MALIPKQSQATDIAPAGTHIARCYSIVDLGSQTYNWEGKPITSRKVRITWELSNETKVFKEENGEQPYIVSKEFTLSLNEKSKLYAFIISWRGKPFTVEELTSFDIFNLLDKPCMLSVVHNDKGYADIVGASKLPKGTENPKAYNEIVRFALTEEDFNQKTFDGLPTFIKDKITQSPEYTQMIEKKEEAEVANDEKFGDEIPF